MKRIAWLLIVYAVVAVMFGCGKKSEQESSSSAPPPAQTSAAPTFDTTATAGLISKYDSGPRANATPVDAAKAAQGEKLFTTKGCVVCHGFGKKVTCPDLAPVAGQRTAEWMEQQILHPDVMTKEDPIAKQLLVEYKTQMTQLHLTPDEAKAVIEYIKKKGH
jgi:mono/diheme cytochrome c family protein